MPRTRFSPYPLREGMKSNWLFQGLVRMAGANADTATRALRFHDLVYGVGLLPPHTTGLKNTNRRKYAAHLRIASMGFSVPQFGALLWSNGFLVAPANWPTAVTPLFPTDSPPTPLEVASLLLGGRPKATRALSADQRMVLIWWLLGAPLDALNALALPPTAEGWAPTLNAAIFALLLQPSFCLWAMGDDLVPAMNGDTRNRIIREALGIAKERAPTEAGGAAHVQALWDDPYIAAILARRAPMRPIERALPSTGVLFATSADKEAAIASIPAQRDVYFARRSIVRTALGPQSVPPWADLSLVAGESDGSAPT